MPQFEAGYAEGLNDIQRREYMRAQIEETKQAAALRQQLFQDRQESKSNEQQVQKWLGSLMEQMYPQEQKAPPVQPPMPGAPSMPPQPPQTAPFGPPGGAPPPMMGGQPPIPMLMGGGGPPGMPGPGGMGAPQPPQGMPPPPPGAMPPPMGAGQAPPPQPPPGWMPSKSAGAELGGGAGGQGIMPKQMPSISDVRQKMDAAGIPVDKQYAVLERAWPMIEAESKQQLAVLKEQAAVYNAMAAAGKAAMAASGGGAKATPYMKEAAALDDPNISEAQKALIRQHLVKQSGLTTANKGYDKPFAELTQPEQAVVDWYALIQLGGDSTWRVGLGRVTGGANLIKAVDEHVAQKAGELGLTPADYGTNKATRTASQSALTQLTKDVTSVKPFAQMLDQNGVILKDLASKVIKTDAALANRPLNWLQENLSAAPDLADFMAQMRIVQTEAARVITNPRLVGELTDTARKDMEQIINGSMPLASTDRVVDRLINDSQRRVGLMEKQQQSLTEKIRELTPGGAGTEAPASDKAMGKQTAPLTPEQTKKAAVDAWGKYEPDKYDYRIGPTNAIQRSPKE